LQHPAPDADWLNRDSDGIIDEEEFRLLCKTLGKILFEDDEAQVTITLIMGLGNYNP